MGSAFCEFYFLLSPKYVDIKLNLGIISYVLCSSRSIRSGMQQFSN